MPGFVAGPFMAWATANNRDPAINPFNHPVDWLSIHEFQYHPRSFDWVPEYNDFERLERTHDMFRHVTIGNDVWTGHNVNVILCETGDAMTTREVGGPSRRRALDEGAQAGPRAEDLVRMHRRAD